MTEKQMMDKVIEHPIASHALLEMLIEDGVKVSVDHTKISHHDRKIILRQIIGMLEARDSKKESGK